MVSSTFEGRSFKKNLSDMAESTFSLAFPSAQVFQIYFFKITDPEISLKMVVNLS